MAKNNLRFSKLAISDLHNIFDYIAKDNPERALSYIGELQIRCQNIAQNPMTYRLREEFGQGVRVARYGKYLIFFALRTDAVLVERICHGARDLHALWTGQPDPPGLTE